MTAYAGKILRDPIHGNIRLPDPMIEDLVDSFEFQRLRRIRQLGSCSLVFHGAEHSRFQHALGAMWLMHLVLDRWSKLGILNLEPEVLKAALAAALLHDIGHGPFSHALEHNFTAVSHEQLGVEIILGPLRQLLESHGCRAQDVVDIISNRYHQPVLCELIAGQLDVDRMDYLQRDSLYTGVRYGLFDSERILDTLRPFMANPSQEELFAEPRGGLVLGVDPKGVLAVEEFLFSRYFMYWQVYLHRAVRSAELLLRLILRRARQVYIEDPGKLSLSANLESLFGLEQSKGQKLKPEFLLNFLSLDDFDLFYGMKLWRNARDPVLADLCDRFLARRLYKGVWLSQYPELSGVVTNRAKKRFGENFSYYVHTETLDSDSYGIYRPGTDRPIRTLARDGSGWIEISRATHSTAIPGLTHQAYTPGGFLFYAPELTE